MSRYPYSRNRRDSFSRESEVSPFPTNNSSEWISSRELAVRLGKLQKDGKPSLGAIHTMVYRKQLVARKFFGRLMFSWSEVSRLIGLSPFKGA